MTMGHRGPPKRNLGAPGSPKGWGYTKFKPRKMSNGYLSHPLLILLSLNFGDPKVGP